MKIVVTEAAYADLIEIGDCFARDNPDSPARAITARGID